MRHGGSRKRLGRFEKVSKEMERDPFSIYLIYTYRSDSSTTDDILIIFFIKFIIETRIPRLPISIVIIFRDYLF